MADPARRPLASRDTSLARRAAQMLVRTQITPNQISMASIGFAALAGMAFWLSGGTSWPWLLLAAVGCQFRLLCNLLDGMVAIEGGKSAPDGPFWNEMPDRLADLVILVGMGAAIGAPALGWAAGAFAILTAYVRELGAGLKMPPDFSGPQAKPHRMALATAAALVAILLPKLAGVPTLEIALWIILIGTVVTVINRSRKMVVWLKSNHRTPPG